MNSRLPLHLCLIALSISAIAEPRPDMLLFTNGDQLRGQFDSISEGPIVQWHHQDTDEAVGFRTSNLRQLVLNEGQPKSPLRSLSHITLVNGDQIPGKIVGLDATHIEIETSYAGRLKVRRDQVTMLAPNPMGGRLHYQGPFAANEWQQIHGNPSNNDDENPDAEAAEEKWKFTGSAWRWNAGPANCALARLDTLPERSTVSFDIAWRGRLNITIALHANFTTPPEPDEDAAEAEPAKQEKKVQHFNAMDPQSLAKIFGSSQLVQLYSNYITHVTTHINDAGDIVVERAPNSNQRMQLGDSGKSRVEIRSNRKSGEILLFLDGEYAAQWQLEDKLDDPEENAIEAGGLGFIVTAKDSPVKISNIVITEWNGMPDAARSLQVDGHDVVLMNNGTDRFAGKVGLMNAENTIDFQGRHGSFKLPIDEIAEIRFDQTKNASAPDDQQDKLRVHMGPAGLIQGMIRKGNSDSLEIDHPCIGPLQLSLDPVTVIEFNPSQIIIDEWSHDF